jgi:hypothetical protein
VASGVLLSACILSACTSPPKEPAAVENGQSLWSRIESDHFVLETNLTNERRATEIAAEFEVLWHAFAAVPVLGLRPPKEKPIVVVLRDRGEFRYFAGEGTAGLCYPKTTLGPLILLPHTSGAFSEAVIKHELAHFVASGSLPLEPKWLSEGLAQVMETGSYDVRKGEILFGAHSLHLVDWASEKVPASRFTQPWPEVMSVEDAAAFYGRSWLLVHYLIDNELQAFLNMIVRMRNGEEWPKAWDKELLVRPNEIDDALDRYFGHAQYGIWRVQAQLPDRNEFRVSADPPADVLALRSVLYANAANPQREASSNEEAAARDLEAARALDPDSARVRKIADGIEAEKKQKKRGTSRILAGR